VNSDHLGGTTGIRVGGTDISGSIKLELINLIIFFQINLLRMQPALVSRCVLPV
jgi:hypothetical protein